MLVISNQAAVGKGLLTSSALEEITRRVQENLANDGTAINAYYYCVHRADEGCACRKPRAGLLLQAAADFNIDLTRSIFIGDSETDVQAAHSARCEPILFGPGVSQSSTSTDWIAGVTVAPTAESLYQAAVQSLRAIAPEAVSA
jgi:histidinol-phosphate phosphatase family protein